MFFFVTASCWSVSRAMVLGRVMDLREDPGSLRATCPSGPSQRAHTHKGVGVANGESAAARTRAQKKRKIKRKKLTSEHSMSELA